MDDETSHCMYRDFVSLDALSMMHSTVPVEGDYEDTEYWRLVKEAVDAIYSKLQARVGEEKAQRIATRNRNLLIFPNLVINDIMAITIRTFYPVAPNQMMVNGWALAPKEESEMARKYRLYNFLEFLGPGGFATPDDVEALEACQAGFSNAGSASWSDISKGMGAAEPQYDDELQMRIFWTRWNELLNAG